MAFRFYRRQRILPGVQVNIGKTLRPTLTLGPRGAKATIGAKGVRTTVGATGTGLFWTKLTPWAAKAPTQAQAQEAAGRAVEAREEGLAAVAQATETEAETWARRAGTTVGYLIVAGVIAGFIWLFGPVIIAFVRMIIAFAALVPALLVFGAVGFVLSVIGGRRRRRRRYF